MDIGEIVNDSIRYPASDWTKIIILAVILLIPIVNFIGMGYVLRIMKASIAGLDDLPEFDEVGDMFIDGLKILIISIVYAIPVWIIAIIFGAIFGALIPTTTTADVSTFSLFGIITANIVFFILLLIVGLIEIIAIVNMAYYDGELGAAFRFSEILDHISRIGWGKYVLTYFIVALISTVGILIASFVGILLLFVGVFITLPLALSYIYMLGSRAISLLFAYSGEPEVTE
jgi:hypothetical protein